MNIRDKLQAAWAWLLAARDSFSDRAAEALEQIEAWQKEIPDAVDTAAWKLGSRVSDRLHAFALQSYTGWLISVPTTTAFVSALGVAATAVRAGIVIIGSIAILGGTALYIVAEFATRLPSRLARSNYVAVRDRELAKRAYAETA